MNLKTGFDILMKMSSLQRYSQTYLIKPESVLEHTGFVVLLSNMIGLKLIEQGYAVDIGLLLSKAAVHDMDEIITGDIPRPTKYYNRGIREAIQEIENANMRLISKHLDLGDVIYNHWAEAKDNDEGFIVAISDTLAVVYKSWQEVQMYGNKAMREHSINLIGNLDAKLIDVQQTMFKNSYYIHDLIHEAIEICNKTQTGEYK